MKFTYRWGQRPLEGYTLKRGLGQGGFGEVYFAISDGGKEVAMKLIRGHTATEVRGIANCLNLKHPHLVHLYDLKVDTQGDRWLIMEYIQGEPLSAIIQRHPRGLPEAQAHEWFLQMAGAVAYLHDHAVVHRDIKPANLFVENGIVKLGDYGLSKALGASQLQQSCNVGTVYYMAPEISNGQYSKQVDIYACGVVLYEMLTGEVPFKGETWGEIALRHQMDLPDLRRVPASYLPILEKSLDKRADKRFASMNEMIEAVARLTRATPTMRAMLPTLAANTAAQPSPQPTLPAIPQGSTQAPNAIPTMKPPTHPAITTRHKLVELSSSLVMTPFLAAAAAALWALLQKELRWGEVGTIVLLATLMSWALLIPTKMLEQGKTQSPNLWLLGALGVLIGLFAFWLDGWQLPRLLDEDETVLPGWESYLGSTIQMERHAPLLALAYVGFFALTMVSLPWSEYIDRHREDRFDLGPLLGVSFIGVILYFLVQIPAGGSTSAHLPLYVILVTAATAGILQLVSPWSPRETCASRRPRRLDDLKRIQPGT